MADLDSLKYQSITEMSNDEALELLRQVRLSRRVPVKTVRTIKKTAKAPAVDSNQAAELLKLLTGDNT